MKKIIGIASSDYHLHNFPNFNTNESSRLDWSLKAADYIAGQCALYDVPNLFAGDLFHNPKELENDTLVKTLLWYSSAYETPRIPFVAIDGNHDQKEKNTITHRSHEYLLGFNSTFHTFFSHIHTPQHSLTTPLFECERYKVYGLPYYTYEKDWVSEIQKLNKVAKVSKGRKILLLHGNAPYAKTTTGQTIEDCMLPKHLDDFFKNWDLVLFGHIHRPQKLSNKCYMLGSPIHQTMGDRGCKMGYWEIHSDFTMKFKSLNYLFPCFKYDTSQKIKPIDYIIPTGQNEPDVDDSSEINGKAFRNLTDRKALSKTYCRTKGIKSKSKREALINILNQA